MKKRLIYGSIFITILISLFIVNVYLNNKINNDNVYDNEDIVKEIKSPEGNNVAIAYVEDGGATTSWIPCVAIKSKKTAFTYGTDIIFVGYRDKYIDIEWKDKDTLNVYYKCKEEDIHKKVEEVDGIKIMYHKK